MVPIFFAVFGLCSTAWYPAAAYLVQIPRLVESVGTCALFQLFVITVSSENRHEREGFFMNLPHKKKAGGQLLDAGGSLQYFRVCHRTPPNLLEADAVLSGDLLQSLPIPYRNPHRSNRPMRRHRYTLPHH